MSPAILRKESSFLPYSNVPKDPDHSNIHKNYLKIPNWSKQLENIKNL